MRRETLIKTALGQTPADLLFINARIVDVFTDEVFAGEVALAGDRIAYVGEAYPGEARITVDLSGAYLSPGLIDAHCHVESSMVAPAVYCAQAARMGTTTFITDPHEIANVCGSEGVRFMLQSAASVPVNYYVQLPSCVPSTPFEHAGAEFTADKMEEFLGDPHILGLGEMMNYPGVAACDPQVMEKLRLFDGRVIDGHAPGISGAGLQAYVCAGIVTDHESVEWAEAREKLRAGMAVLVREGSASKNLDAIISGVLRDGVNTAGLAFCTDDKHLSDIRREGTIRYNVKRAVELGMKPAAALRLATINAARIYRIPHIGAVAPGYRADLVVFEDLREFAVRAVYTGGRRFLAEKYDISTPAGKGAHPRIMDSVHAAPLSEAALRLPPRSQQPVINLVRGQIATKLSYVPGDLAAGLIVTGRLRKIAVVERHHETGNVGVGLIAGYGLNHGAIATTVAHDSHNIIAVGDNDQDILTAVRELERVRGGYTICCDGKAAATLPLPVAGLMSEKDAGEFIPALDSMLEKAREAGVARGIDPFTTLSFMALPVIPEVRVTDMGVFDVAKFAFIAPEQEG